MRPPIEKIRKRCEGIRFLEERAGVAPSLSTIDPDIFQLLDAYEELEKEKNDLLLRLEHRFHFNEKQKKYISELEKRADAVMGTWACHRLLPSDIDGPLFKEFLQAMDELIRWRMGKSDGQKN